VFLIERCRSTPPFSWLRLGTGGCRAQTQAFALHPQPLRSRVAIVRDAINKPHG
jgi:hypothetical protein